MINSRSGVQNSNVENLIDNIRVYPLNPNFIANTREISVATGGTADFTLDAGATYKNSYYFVFSGLSGPSPGFDIGGVHVPLTLDTWTWIAFSLIPYWPGFQGQLNNNGQSTATLDTFGSLPPTAVGVPLYFAYLLLETPYTKPLFGSYPIYVLLIP